MPKENLLILAEPKDLDDWMYVTETVLSSKGLWSIVSGAEPKPAGFPGSKQVKSWETRAEIARSEIVKRIDRHQIGHIRQCGRDPKRIWDRLVAMNSVNGLDGHIELWDKFDELKLTPGGPMTDHIASLRDIAEKLERVYRDKPSDAKFISTLLHSLPITDDWKQFRRNLEGDLQNDDVEYVIRRCLNEYARQERTKKAGEIVVKKEEDSDPSDALVMEIATAAAAAALSRLGQKPKISSLMTQRTGKKKLIKCWKCGGRGHYQSDCPNDEAVEALVAGMPISDDEVEADTVIGVKSYGF